MSDKNDSAIPAEVEGAPEPEATLPEPLVDDHALSHDADGDHIDEEDHHVSLAARSLQILAILLVGGALALWLGPRLAPNLPTGMGAVARWLTPGASLAEDQVAALRAEFNAHQSAQSPQLDLTAIDARIAAADMSADLREQITALALRFDAAEAVPGVLANRIDSIESRLAGAEAMLSAIDVDLRDLVTAGLALDSQAAADIASYAATIDGLRAQLAAMDIRLGEQAARIDTVTAEIRTEAQSAVNSATAAQALSELQATLIALDAALGDGLPYRAEIDWIAATQNLTIPDTLAEYADQGVSSMAQLRDLFPTLAHDAIRTDIRAESGETALGQFGAFLHAQVASRSLTPQQGTTTDAILSRAEDALRQDDLGLALRHMRTLSVAAKGIYADWLAMAQARQAATGGLDDLHTVLSGVTQ